MGLFSKKSDTTSPSTGDKASSSNSVELENGEVVNIGTQVDCIGDSCPRPQLMTKGALSKAATGDIIEVDVDNPTSMEALPPIISDNGGTHLGTVRQARHWQVVMRKD